MFIENFIKRNIFEIKNQGIPVVIRKIFTLTKTFFLILTGTVIGFLIHVLSATIYSLGIANKLPFWNVWVASLAPSIITIMIGAFFVIHFERTN